MSANVPCRNKDNDPEDWFIGRDGKQYRDDELLTDEQRAEVIEGVEVEGLDDEQRVEEVDKALNKAETDAKTEALQRRRHAREKCYGCDIRTLCLDLALRGNHPHGTWGGYYEEEIKEIRREIRRRKRRTDDK